MPEVGDDPVVLDRRVVADLRVRARVDDLQRRAGVHDVAAEGVESGVSRSVADADRALEHLALVGDEREQRDRHVQHLGDEPRDAVEGGLRRRVDQAALGERREPARIAQAVGHRQQRPHDRRHQLGPARALGGVLRRLEGGHLEPDDVALARDVAQQRAQARCRCSPCGTANCDGQDVRVEHVEVEVHVDASARAGAGTTSDGRALPTPAVSTSTRSPASRSRTPHISTRAGSSARLEARVPAPAGRRQAHAAEELARRRLGRVEVAVRVEPQHVHVGRVADDGLERRHADRAVRGGQDREARRPSACPRPGRRPRAGSRASRAGRPRRSRSAARRACRPGARRGPAPARAPPRRARRPACGRTSGSAAPRRSAGRSTPAPASRRTP